MERSFAGRSRTCPLHATTEQCSGRNFLMVRAFVGDSTTMSVLPSVFCFFAMKIVLIERRQQYRLRARRNYSYRKCKGFCQRECHIIDSDTRIGTQCRHETGHLKIGYRPCNYSLRSLAHSPNGRGRVHPLLHRLVGSAYDSHRNHIDGQWRCRSRKLCTPFVGSLSVRRPEKLDPAVVQQCLPDRGSGDRFRPAVHIRSEEGTGDLTKRFVPVSKSLSQPSGKQWCTSGPPCS